MAANGSHPQDHEAITDHSVSFCQSVVVSYKRCELVKGFYLLRMELLSLE